MRIALITIHYANSYGGCLQALAAQEVLSEFGDVTLLDYKALHLKKSMNLIRFGYRFRDYLRMGKDVFRIFPRYRLIKRFEKFFNDNYRLSESISESKLADIESEFDIFVCGSDQLWNPGILEGFDGAYFLNFVGEKPKIAFSSSKGSYHYDEREEDTVRNWLLDFKAISVREKDTADYLSSLLNRSDITVTLDPTLMLDNVQWLNLLELKSKHIHNRYLFVYTLKKNKFTRDLIDLVSRQLNLKIVVIDQDPFLGYRADVHYQDACPATFVKLISGASFVITNSFHGTAFAVNFETPFIAIKPETGSNRIISFLENVGLSNRYIEDLLKTEEIIHTAIDFHNSREKLNQFRSQTRSYLEQSIDSL